MLIYNTSIDHESGDSLPPEADHCKKMGRSSEVKHGSNRSG